MSDYKTLENLSKAFIGESMARNRYTMYAGIARKEGYQKIAEIFITTMGAGVHAHPKGTQAGAKALVQACEAYSKRIDIKKYAKTHKELAEAIGFFSKKGKK